MKYGKELRCLNTKGKYSKVTNTENKWSIISKSVRLVIFVEFIDQLIDYLINRASLNPQHDMLFWSDEKNVNTFWLKNIFSRAIHHKTCLYTRASQ